TTRAVATHVGLGVVSMQGDSCRPATDVSGSTISADGDVLPNDPVVSAAEQGGIIQVTINDGSKHDAEFVASDVNTAVAVIKIQDVQDLPFLEFGNSDSLQVGQ